MFFYFPSFLRIASFNLFGLSTELLIVKSVKFNLKLVYILVGDGYSKETWFSQDKNLIVHLYQHKLLEMRNYLQQKGGAILSYSFC